MDDLEAIRQLKARYFRAMDTKDWAGMRQVFADDVVLDTSEAGGSVVSGADEFMTFLQEVLSGTVTVHQGHMPEIELTSRTTATGIWALNDIVIWPDGTRLIGYGHYHETYEKVGDDWKIKSSKLTRLHTDIQGPESGRPHTGLSRRRHAPARRHTVAIWPFPAGGDCGSRDRSRSRRKPSPWQSDWRRSVGGGQHRHRNVRGGSALQAPPGRPGRGLHR